MCVCVYVCVCVCKGTRLVMVILGSNTETRVRIWDKTTCISYITDQIGVTQSSDRICRKFGVYFGNITLVHGF